MYYYQLYFVQFTPWKRQNELYNHFVEGHPSSIKFTIDLASHVLHSLLGTMFTVYVVSMRTHQHKFFMFSNKTFIYIFFVLAKQQVLTRKYVSIKESTEIIIHITFFTKFLCLSYFFHFFTALFF